MFSVLAALAWMLVMLTVIISLIIEKGRRKANEIQLSGPRGWPLVGNLFQLDQKRPDLTMIEWSKLYGPVYVITIVDKPFVIACGYEAIHEVLVTNEKTFANRGGLFRRLVLSDGGQDISSSDPSRPHWFPLKKLLYKIIKQSGENGFDSTEDLLLQMTRDFVAKVSKYAGKQVDIRDDIYYFNIQILFILMTGKKPSDDDPLLDDVIRLERKCESNIGTKGLELDALPWLRFLGHPVYLKLKEARLILQKLWDQQWSEYLKTKSTIRNSTKRGDLMYLCDRLIHDASSEEHQELFTMKNMQAVFLNIILGGLASSTSLMYSWINILLHHPSVYARLQQEVDSVIGFQRSPTLADRKLMPYTQAVMYETLRYTSMAPFAPHTTTHDTTLQGIKLPAGTTVLTMFNAVHYDEHFWPEPFAFRPERFLTEEGQLHPVDHPHRKHLVAFGGGTRACPGEMFAMRRLFIFITSLMQAFDLKPGDTLVSCDPREFIEGLVLFPLPYTVRFTLRAQRQNLQ